MTNQEQPAEKMTFADLLKNPELLDKLADRLVASRTSSEKPECQLVLEAFGRRLVDMLADNGSLKHVADVLASVNLKVRADKLRECVLTVLNDGLSKRTGKERAHYDLAISNMEKDAYGVPRKKGGEKPASQPACPPVDVKPLEEEIQRLKTELDQSSSMRKSLEEELQVASKQNLTASAKFYKDGFHQLRQLLEEKCIDIPEAVKTPPAISTPPHTHA